MFRKIFFAAGLFLPAHAWAGVPGDGYYHHMDGWGYGMMGFGFMGLFWIVLAVLVVFAIRWLAQDHRGAGSRAPDAVDILRERLARGEIDVEEFEARKAALGK
ncbi:hypothetical protein GQE99_18450 [Maritimibacter sp. DP07]|uniref:SHOCT domain-containing protein n=1 Tax=Maritimibacter harenae TaxID=2606218 RepID=A0A845M4Q0_9RHOB|nr:SHOCT domain-containing protein [Maritimibacter harenae]MZR15005.1 hypothetical protein [Maritimibacter harenae]